MKLNFEGEPEDESDNRIKIPQTESFYNEQVKIEEIYNLKVSIKFIQILSLISIVFCILFTIFQIFQDYQFSTFQKELITLKNEIQELKLKNINNNKDITKEHKFDKEEKDENNNNDSNKQLTNDKKIINFSAETIKLKEKFKTEIIYLQDCMTETKIKNFQKYENPKISILIPDYKTENYINRLIQSIQKQKLKEIEIIFVVNNSTKKEFPKLEEINKNDKRIIILKNDENKGLLNLYMKGISIIKSKYMMFLEEGGMLLPKLDELYNITEKYNKDINDFSYLIGTINGITYDERKSEVEKNQPEISRSYYNENFINENNLLNKIIKTEAMKNSIKKIKKDYFEEKFILHVDTLLYISLCTYAPTYKSFGNMYGEYHLKTELKKDDDNLAKLFDSTLYLAQFIYELKCDSKNLFNERSLLIINLLNWPLNYNKNLKIDDKKCIKVINMFISNGYISEQNQRKMDLLIKKIEDRGRK